MERVQFQQEQMLAELKDLVEKGLFTLNETKLIMKKRTVFETALVRRVAKKADFLRYAAYEMGLEQLRRKRKERLKLPSSPASVSDYALVRRQFQIFERALKKFKSDVGLWVQYVEVAKREGARSLVGRITARALQLHPNTPSLYILAASHELDHLSPSAARALLQRGIRLNSSSVEMWTEYVRMELGFVESLRRRWDVLGINAEASDGKDKEKAMDVAVGIETDEEETDAHTPKATDMDVDIDIQGDEGSAARKEIMEGAIVKSVISSAVQAIPRIELFASLNTLISEYPSSPDLRQAFLAHIHQLLRLTLPNDAGSVKLLSSRFLIPGLKGEHLVEALRRANEEMLQSVNAGPADSGAEDLRRVYAEFVEEWCGIDIENNLKLYLISSLRSLIQRTKGSSPSLLSAHIRLLVGSQTQQQSAQGSLADPAKILRTARKYTSKAPKSAQVWLARLAAEKQFGKNQDDIGKVWKEARSSVEGSKDELESVWIWGLESASKDAAEVRRRTHEDLLKESMRDSSLRDVHELLLMDYVTLMMHEGGAELGTGLTSDQQQVISAKLHLVRHMDSAYLATAKVWQKMFALEAERHIGFGSDGLSKGRILEEVFERWRRVDGVEAALEWGSWLFRNGRGMEAKEVIVGARSWVGEEEKTELEKRWTAILDEAVLDR